MLEAVERYHPTPNLEAAALRTAREMHAARATPLGTMPPPASMREVGTTAVEMLKGNKAAVFVDKLGDRMAFERTGSRLYQGLIARFESSLTWEGGPSLEMLEEIRRDELSHFAMLRETVLELGSDPTVVTPSADVCAVASMGLIQVVNDPRIKLSDALHAILVAELVDNEGWSLLIELADELGHEGLSERFAAAQSAEESHLQTVRSWITAAVTGDATMALDEQRPESLREAS
jgi:rubrerythrin